jgi:adenylate cyclase
MFLVLVSAGVVLIGMAETGYEWSYELANACEPIDGITTSLKTLKWKFILGAVAGLGTLALVILFVSRLIVNPVKSLISGVQEISRGNYAHRIEKTTPDEIGYLTNQFNLMAQGLQEREFIRDTFGRFVSPDVANRVLETNPSLGGELCQAVILFSDLRGFTTFSEHLPPETVVTHLNSYFSQMDSCIQRHGGWINKYLGDGLLAIFGAPVSLENPYESAVKAALDMQEALLDFNKRQNVECRMGVGIHAGEIVIGNIGSQARMEYTCIGDTVNTSARIEELTGRYHIPILMSSQVQSRIDPVDLPTTPIDRVYLRGKSDELRIYGLVDNTETPNSLTTAEQEQFLDRYFEGSFQNALSMIEGRELTPHQKLIAERCSKHLNSPPSNWKGVSVIGGK